MARRYSRSLSLPVTIASAQLLGPNPNRVAVLLSSHDVTLYAVAFGEEATATTGILVHPGTAPILLRIEDYGESIRGPINVIGGGGFNIAVTEVSQGP